MTIDETDYFIRPLTALQKSAIDAASLIDGKFNARAYSETRFLVFIYCLVDESGNRLLDESDLEWVKEMPESDFGPIYEEMRRVSGLDRDGVKAAEKNSAGTEG